MPANDPQSNKAVVRRFIDEVFVGGRTDAVDELLSDDFTAHTFGAMEPGRAGIRAAMARVAQGLSDEAMRIDDMVAEGDRVAVRLTSAATQTGTFMGMPPSGRRYEIEEIHWFRLRDGQIAEHWHQADFLGMQRQLTGDAAASDGGAAGAPKAEPAGAR
jgi:steroid delta-isomerase-like uncharacterized protein